MPSLTMGSSSEEEAGLLSELKISGEEVGTRVRHYSIKHKMFNRKVYAGPQSTCSQVKGSSQVLLSSLLWHTAVPFVWEWVLFCFRCVLGRGGSQH